MRLEAGEQLTAKHLRNYIEKIRNETYKCALISKECQDGIEALKRGEKVVSSPFGEIWTEEYYKKYCSETFYPIDFELIERCQKRINIMFGTL